MKNFEAAVKNAISAVEDVATAIQEPNIEEYVREACWNHSEEIFEALNDGDFNYAALMIVLDDMFN